MRQHYVFGISSHKQSCFISVSTQNHKMSVHPQLSIHISVLLTKPEKGYCYTAINKRTGEELIVLYIRPEEAFHIVETITGRIRYIAVRTSSEDKYPIFVLLEEKESSDHQSKPNV